MAYRRRSQNPTGSASYHRAAPARVVCHGLADGGGCKTTPTLGGFCTAHQEQAVWLNPAAARISAAERRAHAEQRRCCGLTKMNALCRNNPGGNFLFCPVEVGPAPGPETPQRAVLRARMREFQRMKAEAEADVRRWHEEARARADREEKQWRQRREEEQRQQRDRPWERAQQEEPQWEWHQSSYQRRRREETRGAGGAEERARQAREEERRREDEQRQEQEEANERARRQRRDGERRAGAEQDLRMRPQLLERYLKEAAVFDATIFSARNPNSFSRIPWPLFPGRDDTVRIGDVTPANVRMFFDAKDIRNFKTARA
ncbi:hypothetical protein DFH09DRAFT_1274933 [Mycena vulgaris]|nr:hypothetical protein DFH09DRAFT_1274933 [Mycena vulgaris]